MYLIKRGHRILERTTGEARAREIATAESDNEMIQVVEHWDDMEDRTVAWYINGQEQS